MNAETFLNALLRSSLAAGVLGLLVLATQWHCALWLLVAARLVPVSFSSDVSMFNLFSHPIAPMETRASLYQLVTQPLRAANAPAGPEITSGAPGTAAALGRNESDASERPAVPSSGTCRPRCSSSGLPASSHSGRM